VENKSIRMGQFPRELVLFIVYLDSSGAAKLYRAGMRIYVKIDNEDGGVGFKAGESDSCTGSSCLKDT